MNNWQHLYETSTDLALHLRKPYFRYDNKEKDISKFVFDPFTNLVWVGDTYGCVSAYDPHFRLYSRSKAHIGSSRVYDILPLKGGVGVLSLSEDSLHLANRRGVTLFNLTGVDITTLSGLRCMCTLTPDNYNAIYCAGENPVAGISCLDLGKVELNGIIEYKPKVKLLKSTSKLLAIGQNSGSVDLLDHNSHRVVKTFQAHSDTITSMDIRGYTLITAGTSRRFHNTYADPFVNVYDLRMMKQLSPIAFSKSTTTGSNAGGAGGGAEFVQLHPVLPTVALVGSSQGSFDFIDLSNPTSRAQYVHPGTNIKDIVMSPNGNYLSVIENDNCVSLWSRTPNSIISFTASPEMLEYPDFPEDTNFLAPLPKSVDDPEYPLNSIGLPYYYEPLLSAWPHVIFTSEGTVPNHVDTNDFPLVTNNSATPRRKSPFMLLNNANLASKKFPFHKYDRSKYGGRNVAPRYVYLKDQQKRTMLTHNREGFLNYKSVKPGGSVTSTGSGNNSSSSSRSGIDIGSGIGTTTTTITSSGSSYISSFETVPPAYNILPSTSGRHGPEGFDFKGFNRTQYAGLDTDIDNSYMNSLLQLYRFVPEIFNFVVGCLRDENFHVSLLTELGYLYDMMAHSAGGVCRASNFQESLSLIKDAKDLGLLEDNFFQSDDCAGESMGTDGAEGSTGGPGSPLKPETTTRDKSKEAGNTNNVSPDKPQRSRIQNFNNFLLSHLLQEEQEFCKADTSTLEQCYGLRVVSEYKFKCGHQEKQNSIESSLSIVPHQKNGSRPTTKKSGSQQSILTYIESSMKCGKRVSKACGTCQRIESGTCERAVTNLPPMLSLELLLSESEWKTIKTVKNWLAREFYATVSKQRVTVRADPREFRTSSSPVFKYELVGYVARITDPDGDSRLVTYCRVFDPEEHRPRWYMFNNYLVVEILEEEEVLNLSYSWKRPEIVVYCDAEECRKPFFTVDNRSINYDILYRDYFTEGTIEGIKREYKLLTKSEAPKPGSLVAIDAEFVVLRNELDEIDCQGVKTVVKSKRSVLARLSAIRGDEGELSGVPFIDDYVVIKNHIVDYLTKYSGINPGDLDPAHSAKPLVPREVVYRKVWLLLKLGCVFVGHGLSNDFKHINLNVPKEQIRDTAVYFLQGKRFLSLKFLAFLLLGKNVQTGNHDSIEDAYTALILYRKYLELKDKGTLAQTIDLLYEEGRVYNYKVPESLDRYKTPLVG